HRAAAPGPGAEPVGPTGSGAKAGDIARARAPAHPLGTGTPPRARRARRADARHRAQLALQSCPQAGHRDARRRTTQLTDEKTAAALTLRFRPRWDDSMAPTSGSGAPRCDGSHPRSSGVAAPVRRGIVRFAAGGVISRRLVATPQRDA